MTYRTQSRQRAEIMLEMMRTAKEPILLMNLRSKCNICWSLNRKLSVFLIKKGFMEVLPMAEKYKKTRDRRGAKSTKVYRTTRKGVNLLEQVEGSTLYELFTYRSEAEG